MFLLLLASILLLLVCYMYRYMYMYVQTMYINYIVFRLHQYNRFSPSLLIYSTCIQLSCFAPPSTSTPLSLSLLEFPLTCLNLMDYCYVSDVGVANIASMTTLVELTLSKTKLTDSGMHSVAGNTSFIT